MTRLKRFVDPSVNFDKNSSVRYPLMSYTKEGKLTKALDASAPYLSNIANSFRRLPPPPVPITEGFVTPRLINLDASRAVANNKFNAFNKNTDYTVANTAVRQALKAQAMGENVANLNNVAQTEANQNSQIRTQADITNQNIEFRNTQRRNDFNEAGVSRNIKQQDLQIENLSNFGDKYQMQRRDNSMFDLEGRRIDLLYGAHPDTDVDRRNLKGNFERAKRGLTNRALGGEVDPIAPIKSTTGIPYFNAMKGEVPSSFRRANIMDSTDLYNKGIRIVEQAQIPKNLPSLGKDDYGYVASGQPDSTNLIDRNMYLAKLKESNPKATLGADFAATEIDYRNTAEGKIDVRTGALFKYRKELPPANIAKGGPDRLKRRNYISSGGGFASRSVSATEPKGPVDYRVGGKLKRLY